jgi:thioredoxin reductase
MKSQRAVVVGAGAAGLTAADTLQRGGVSCVVLEKEAWVGGKCRSYTYKGVAYDVGANLTTPRYERVRPLAEKLGLTLRELPGRRIVSVDGSAPPEVPSGLIANALIDLGEKAYLAFRFATGIDQPGYAGLNPPVFVPFGEWLERHHLDRFAPMFANLFVAYGYGDMMDQPAAYALKFFDRVHMDIALDVIQRKPVSASKTFAEGFQELWERFVVAKGIDVRREVVVTSIERAPDKVTASWRSADGVEHVEEFDHLVLACPLDAALGFLDAAEEERELFSQLRYNDYYVTGAILSDAPVVSTFVHPYGSSVHPGQPTIYYPPIPGHPDRVYFFYAYGGPGVTEESVRSNIVTVMDHPGVAGSVDELLETTRWRYFPHVTPEVAQSGFYDRLDALQGRWRTLYVGEVVAFTLVELIVEHTEWIVSRHLFA